MSLSFEEICCYWKMRFREMLQNGIDLSSVDVNYVSSRSWYLLNLFRLRGFFSLILGEENAMDDTQRMMQMGGFGFDASKYLDHLWAWAGHSNYPIDDDGHEASTCRSTENVVCACLLYSYVFFQP
ncbi:ER membrane protein complex subunit 3 protein [Dioscorea alata]|uniref:ER membrane protein complex subunit 3 protein n=1 Tax=Dioscorea alata TaxID=55571 RepID=A0ACB7V217_DIOAL|nr:ER membrane protein complex subunit 3 protein [Dioscorea alata]